MRNRIIIVLFGVLMSCCIYAQTVSGSVLDEDGLPVVDASVENISTGESVLTDLEGNFTISANKGDNLTISTFDYRETSIEVGEGPLNIMLESEGTLDEVVAIGYGTQKKELVTGSYSSIDSDELLENNPTTVSQAIQGKASGVQINNTSGSPGATPTIRIRGITTNGNNNPLIVVDGVQIGNDISVIDPNDIETIDIIKDASTAIYGVQGANGVVLITTKSGKKNKKPTFTYNGFFSIQENANSLDLMDSQEYAAYWNEYVAATGETQLPYPNFQSLNRSTDWQSALFNTADMQSHSFSAQGGGQKTTYNFSANYLDQNGIISPEKSNFDRLTLRGNLKFDILDNLRLGGFVLYTHKNQKNINESGRGSALYYASNASPLDPIYDGRTIGTSPSNGFYYVNNGTSQEIINPLATVYNTYNKTKAERFTGQAFLEWDIINDLTATTRYNFNTSTVDYVGFFPLSYYGPNKVNNNVQVSNEGLPNEAFILDTSPDGTTPPNGVRDQFNRMQANQEKFFDFQWETFLEYSKQFGGNDLSVVLGTSLIKRDYEGEYKGGYLTNYVQDEQGNIIYLDSWNDALLVNTTPYNTDEDFNNEASTYIYTQGQSDYRTSSFFGRLQYDYENRYLFSAILRRDYSNIFGPDNRSGFFPSFSAGWVVSKESFFNVSWMDQFKIRGSWGQTGNDKIQLNAYYSLMQINPEASYNFGGNYINGAAYGRLANPELKWETNTQLDIGVDLEFLQKRLSLTFDYFSKKTKDLLLQPQVSAITGAYAPGSGAPWQNVGNVENKGFEFGINYTNKPEARVKFFGNYNLTHLKNKVTQTNGGDLVGGLFGLSTPTSVMQVGLPMGAFWGYQADGVFQNQAEVNAHADQNNVGNGAAVGGIRYRDINGDGVISDADKTMIGNPIPEMLMGLNLGAAYKNFDFAISFYASFNNDIARAYERFQPQNNRLAYYLDRWTGEGTSSEVPSAAYANEEVFSSFYVEDGSYVRIQNIQLGYDFSDFLNFTSVKKARVYFAVNNPFTFTDYKGYTPELNNGYALSAGVDNGQYPIVRSFVSGLTLNF